LILDLKIIVYNMVDDILSFSTRSWIFHLQKEGSC
jgi:hypothetical protein